jgi:hypothetical protein
MAVGNSPAAPHTPHFASLRPYWMLREGHLAERGTSLPKRQGVFASSKPLDSQIE